MRFAGGCRSGTSAQFQALERNSVSIAAASLASLERHRIGETSHEPHRSPFGRDGCASTHDELGCAHCQQRLKQNAVSSIAPDQCRMARAALHLGVRDLARLAGLSAMTVTRFENGRSGGNLATISALRDALEAKGVIFVSDGEVSQGGRGIRLRAGEQQ